MQSATEKSLSRFSSPLALLRRGGNARELAQTFWVISDQSVVSLASFLSTVIVGRTCGREQLGIYVLATTTFWLLAGIPNALAWTPYTARAPRMSVSRRARYSGSVTVHMGVITVAIAGTFLIVGMLPSSLFGQGAWFSWMCLALVPFTIAMTLREHVRRICLSRVAAHDMLLFDIPIAAVQLLLLIVLARWGTLTAGTALLAVGGACLFAAIWIFVRRSEFSIRPRSAGLHWSYNLQFGRWLLAVSIAWLVGDSMYRWIVGWQYGLEGLGQFGSAQVIVLLINPMLLTATNFGLAVSANRFAKGGLRELRRFTLQATIVVTAVASIAFVMLAMVGGDLVTLFFGGEFTGLGGVVATLCLGMMARVIGVPVDASLSALRQGRALFGGVVIQSFVIVVSGIPLVAHYGLNGVGYTMALAYGATAIFEWIWFLRCHAEAGVDRPEVFAPALEGTASLGA